MIAFFSIPSIVDPELNFALLTISSILLIIICFRLIVSKNLIESVLLMSAFSLVIAICYLFTDAPDVAMTETALGACLSTCVLLNLVKIIGNENYKSVSKTRTLLAVILCVILILLLTIASLDLPLYGRTNTEVQSHLTKYYIENTKNDIGIPSIVAAILASYRGFDTLGETSVILIAGIAVVLILARRRE